MTPVYDIYSRVTTIIEDDKYNKLSDEEIEYIFEKFVETSIIMFKEMDRKYKPRIVEDELGNKFIKKTKNVEDLEDDGLDLEEQVILAHGMLVSWHNAQVLRDRCLKQNMNTRDFNQLSGATMLANNEQLHKRIYNDFLVLRRKYKSRNSDLGDL